MLPDTRKRLGASKGSRPRAFGWDHRLGQIPKELIEIVQVAEGPGPNIRSVQHVASYLIARRHLEFAVGIAAAIGKFEDARCPEELGDTTKSLVVLRCS